MLIIRDIKSLTVKLFFLIENFYDSNFAAVKNKKLKDMKKYLLLIGVIISLGNQAFAEKYGVCMEYHQLGQGTQSTTVRRSPSRLPVDVFYNNETHQIEVTSSDEVSAQVFLCDKNGNTLDYSPCINAVLDVPHNYNGIIIIRIDSANWIATGKIAI